MPQLSSTWALPETLSELGLEGLSAQTQLLLMSAVATARATMLVLPPNRTWDSRRRPGRETMTSTATVEPTLGPEAGG